VVAPPAMALSTNSVKIASVKRLHEGGAGGAIKPSINLLGSISTGIEPFKIKKPEVITPESTM
jgi:hypothetical protein